MLGSTEPRLWTPPLRELTPATSVGFDQCDFAEFIGHPFDPWQQWLVIHAGELLPDGRPRFRKVLVLVSRQNGKTTVPKVLSLFWMYVDRFPMTLGLSTKVDYAREVWDDAIKLSQRCPDLDSLNVRRANGEQECWTPEGSRYKIAAANRNAGRSLTVNRLIVDELRQHKDYTAWDSAIPTMSAVMDAQAWCLSNAGDENSVVLNELRDAAISFIETGEGDHRLGLFEWSAPDDADPLDLNALAQANPNLGRRIDPDGLLADARRSVVKGGAVLAGFKTEYMCIRVKLLDPAIDPGAWLRCLDSGTLEDARSRVALCIDVAPSGLHATLYAAAVLADGRVRVDPVTDWSGPDLAKRVGRDVPQWVTKIKPKAFGWLPNGPAAALAADLTQRPGWPPPGVTVTEIRGDLPAVAMGFEAAVKAGQIAHSADPLLDAQVAAAQRLKRGDAWVYSRRGTGDCDALYAAAGAVHLARTLPPPVGKPRVLMAVP